MLTYEKAIAARLKSSRKKAGFRSARDAAASLGVSYPTYAGHENGSRGIREADLIAYSKAFNVSVNFLAFDSGNLSRRFVLPLIDLFGQNVQMDQSKLSDVAIGLVEVNPPFPIPEGLSAVRIPDGRFCPHYFSGELLLVAVSSSPVDCIAKRSLFLIETSPEGSGGRVAIPGTVLRKGDHAEAFDVQESNGRVHVNVKVIWSAQVVGVVSEPRDPLP